MAGETLKEAKLQMLRGGGIQPEVGVPFYPSQEFYLPELFLPEARVQISALDARKRQ